MNPQNPIKTSIIAAIDSKTHTIGKEDGGIPWHISEDFKYFREKTMGHPIIMGRTTWEEFKGKPLPSRPHVIVTRNTDYTAKIDPEAKAKDVRIFVIHNLEFAIKLAKDLERQSPNPSEIFIIGGAKIYQSALPFCDRLYLTLVQANTDGPAKFPDYQSAGFTKIISSRKSSDENFNYEFVVLEK